MFGESMTTNQKSSQQLNESLSALMDGEASELEVRRIIKSDDADLKERWHRYQLASATMKGEFKLESPVDLSASISAAIAEEATYSQPAKQQGHRHFWSRLGRFGVAASVAGAVVIGVQLSSVNGGLNVVNNPPAASSPASGSIDLQGDTSVSVVGSQSKANSAAQRSEIIINEETQQKLQQMEGEVNRLMLEHAQNASQNTQQGLLPFVRVPDSE